ncbi:hypothetical protein [Allonocardiopsis opalescens]|uniref:Uncharacterized protein n=1 Tax=Allonocardiopsis opalescens TaxID=1144618 RepID=A0A2T0PVX5_9ACTN|nr:hypothetical protein [Allonocardiopsis opalescens]PRX95580.1 hypothetical protein CLV72_109189 [Allonocardiopsis opalescens]
MTPQEFAAQRRGLTEQLIDALLALFRSLGAWHEPQAAEFAAQAVPMVHGAQQMMGALVAARTAELASAALGVPVTPPGLPDDVLVDLRGVPGELVYHRPFATVYTHLGRGEQLDEALQRGATRLAEIAEADLQQTYAHAAQAAMEAVDVPAADRPRFWRRVLVGSENCGLCVVASTQRYRVEDLNPIHPGCDCEVAGIFGADPGQVIDPELLERVHEAVEELTGASDRGARAVDYRSITVEMIREHGELGPMLARPRDRFTGPGDL